MEDVEAIERATLAAMPPQALRELPGWLVGLDHGTVNRARSAVPLQHRPPQPGVLAQLEAIYGQQGLPCALRLAQLPVFDALVRQLQAAGYAAAKPTLVQTGGVAGLASLAQPREVVVQLATAPEPRWEQVFLGEGFDPVDGASRLAILRRARDSLFAGIECEGRLVAVGSACLAQGWCGIHGMRTLPAWRGRGYASAILAAFGRAARQRGVARCFLQVEAGNLDAQALYRKAGLATAWGYVYWKR